MRGGVDDTENAKSKATSRGPRSRRDGGVVVRLGLEELHKGRRKACFLGDCPVDWSFSEMMGNGMTARRKLMKKNGREQHVAVWNNHSLSQPGCKKHSRHLGVSKIWAPPRKGEDEKKI